MCGLNVAAQILEPAVVIDNLIVWSRHRATHVLHTGLVVVLDAGTSDALCGHLVKIVLVVPAHLELHPLGSCHDVQFLLWCLPAEAAVERNCRLTALTAFGGNDNYTVRTARAIDGSRCSVLQYLDALDVGGV